MKKIGEMNMVEFAMKFTLAEIVISLIQLAGFIGACQIKKLKTDRKEDDE